MIISSITVALAALFTDLCIAGLAHAPVLFCTLCVFITYLVNTKQFAWVLVPSMVGVLLYTHYFHANSLYAVPLIAGTLVCAPRILKFLHSPRFARALLFAGYLVIQLVIVDWYLLDKSPANYYTLAIFCGNLIIMILPWPTQLWLTKKELAW